jgi:ABC-type Mn2+/Zn2+ transport system permease subunit
MGFLEEAFLLNALAAALISGALCAFLGVYVHLKRIIFIGIALSETAALGVAAGLYMGIWPEASASALTVLVSLLFWWPGRDGFLSREALLGLVYCVAAALAILLLAVNPMAEAHRVDLMSGNLLYTMGDDILLLSLLAAGTMTLHLLLFPKFLFVSLDPETARTLGLQERTVEFLMYLTIGLCIAVSMKTTGILFVFSSMVIPPMVGLVLCRRVWAVFAAAVVTAVAASFLGLWASFAWDLPTGPAIVCVEGILFLLAVVARVFTRA